MKKNITQSLFLSSLTLIFFILLALLLPSTTTVINDNGPDSVLEEAKHVLAENWIGHSTKPAPNLYPHQWSWDSAFISIGKSHYDQDQAQEELTSLFRGQWENGMLPHIVFNPNVSDYFPGPSFWNCSELTSKAPSHPKTSGIIQPPVHATAVLSIVKNSPDRKKALKWARTMFPKLAAFHRYLYAERNNRGDGLIYIRHPWESGMDNSPLWDTAMNNMHLTPGMVPPYNRSDTHHVNATDRPTEWEYDRYVYLVALAKNHSYDEAQIRNAEPFNFLIVDVLFNSILVQANRDLATLATMLRLPSHIYVQWAEMTAHNINAKLWDENAGIYRNYDLVQDEYVPLDHSYVGSAFSPIYAHIPSDAQASAMSEQMLSNAFCSISELKQKECWAIPTFDRHSLNFSTHDYWRGPNWINIDWLLWRGCRSYYERVPKLHLYAQDAFEHSVQQLPAKVGFYEYFNPLELQGHGTDCFSWTAALLIDMKYTLAKDGEDLAEPNDIP